MTRHDQFATPKNYRYEGAPSGPCHYYRTRTGQRLLFRQSEILRVDPTPLGAVVVTHAGAEYKVTSPKPEQIVREDEWKPTEPQHQQIESSASRPGE